MGGASDCKIMSFLARTGWDDEIPSSPGSFEVEVRGGEQKEGGGTEAGGPGPSVHLPYLSRDLHPACNSQLQPHVLLALSCPVEEEERADVS